MKEKRLVDYISIIYLEESSLVSLPWFYFMKGQYIF